MLLKIHCIDILIMRLYDGSYRYMVAWHYDIDRHMICGTQVDHVPTCYHNEIHVHIGKACMYVDNTWSVMCCHYANKQ